MERPFLVLSQVVRILERHQVPYVVVGSLAGSMHGSHSPTADIDLLADIKPEHVRPLLDALNECFLIDDQATQNAVEHRSFNARTFDSEFKVDIVIPKGDDFARSQLARRERKRIPESDLFVNVASAADTILERLRRYRDGDEVSTAHWADVREILGVTDFALEFEYLRDWSDRLGVRDLLDRALTSARDRSSSRDKP